MWVADEIYRQHLGVSDPAMLEFMYRTYVQGAIPKRPLPKRENVALGIEEFGSRPALHHKSPDSFIDDSLLHELDREGLFARLYGEQPK